VAPGKVTLCSDKKRRKILLNVVQKIEMIGETEVKIALGCTEECGQSELAAEHSAG
jgi:hypothetical protein